MGYQSAEVIAAMQRDARMTLSELRVDGGAALNDVAMQFQADVLGVDVVRPRVTETTALGAAYLAGLQSGYWPDLDAVANQWLEDRRFVPGFGPERRAELLAGWRRAVKRSRGWSDPTVDGATTNSPATLWC
jgi:glycerol kinase